MYLESNGFLTANYRGRVFNIFSEPNENDYTIELIDSDFHVFTVNLSDVTLIQEIKVEKLKIKQDLI